MCMFCHCFDIEIFHRIRIHLPDKRFLHSIQELAGKKVLIVGAGTIGNLLVEYAMNSGVNDITIVDMDAYEYWNLPMIFE